MMSVIDSSLFPGKLGPDVGCMGAMLRVIKKWPDFVEKIGSGLRKLGVRDLVSIPFNSDMEVLSVGCGFVYDIIEAIAEGIREPMSDFLFRLANGIPESFDMTTDCVVTVRLTIPPFPYPLSAEDKLEIIGLDEHNLKHVFLSDVCFLDDKYFACTTTGNTLKAAARGRDLREAQRRVYRTLGNISIPAKQYRNDVGDCVSEVLSSDSIRELIYA
jgi:hypothetical protein